MLKKAGNLVGNVLKGVGLFTIADEVTQTTERGKMVLYGLGALLLILLLGRR